MPTPHCTSLSFLLITIILSLLVTQSAGRKYWLYMGAGGCDSDDPSCQPPSPTDSSTIYIAEFDSDNGNISLVDKVTGFAPDWLHVHPSRRFLFAVDSTFGVASLSIDPRTGALTRVNTVNTPGGTVFMDVNPRGTLLFVASYTQGTISLFPINPNTGVIGSMLSSLQFYGSGPNPNRQQSPHPHSINSDRKSDGRFVYVPDLGLDTVFSFRVSPNGQYENTTYTNVTKMYPGAGPRHMAFHPTLRIAYVLSEMGSTITTFKHDPTVGYLMVPAVQTSKTLPDNFTGFSKAAEVHVHPDGRWLFASNRGFNFPTNSITVFRVDGSSGVLTLSGRYPTGGTFPRGMEIAPEGDFLVVGGQDTNNVATMKFDSTTGALTPTGFQLSNIATPVTFAFVPQL